MRSAIALFLQSTPWVASNPVPMATDASARVYYRVKSRVGTAVLMVAPPEDVSSFERFIRVADWLRANDLSAPKILQAKAEKGMMLLEDFGDDVVSRLADRSPVEEARLYMAASNMLVRLKRIEPPPWLETLNATGLAQIAALACEELPDHAEADTTLREELVGRLSEVLQAELPAAHIVSLRDLHAGNMIWLPDRLGCRRVGLLDFQDAVIAPSGYDLASLLDDPRRNLPQELRARLITTHAAATGQTEARLRCRVDLLSLARNLRILGIFRRVARLRDRPDYLDFLPRTAELIRRAAQNEAAAPLRDVVDAVLAAQGQDQLQRDVAE